ncbi:MAG: hypothetical protein K9L83_09375 [Deltaproteobacteria bacterium]|nr:hypothetical protein [Deltaproteobacteria bacterium]
MDLMDKSDLIYDDYSWTAYGDDNPKVSGEPDSTLLNRKEGYDLEWNHKIGNPGLNSINWRVA